MNSSILTKLRAIEADSDLKILYACESGSRAWQFPSPDSDYDVRFIYVRPADAYLSVTEQADHLSFPINDELDLYGWDLIKVLRLARKSNVTPFEWLQSPIIYREEPGFRNKLLDLCRNYFGQRSNTWHYLGICHSALESMSKEGTIGIKKLFYVIRPLLAAKWCVERNSIAPMSINPLMELMPEQLQVQLKELILQKSTVGEKFPITPPAALMHWILETEEDCKLRAAGLENKTPPDARTLDHFLRKTIKEYDDSRS